MKLIEDFLPVLRSSEITFLRSHQESGDVTSFEFEKHEKLTWKAGQHGLFMFPRTYINGLPFRAFSIASSPQEKVLRIATRIPSNPSDFKKHLLGLAKGNPMRMRGPFGPFYLSRHDVSVAFVAGGIGITPFLGFLRHFSLETNNLPRSVHFFYSTTERPPSFKDEIEGIRGHLPFVDATYVAHRDQLLKKLDGLVAEKKGQVLYYISGPGSMIRGIRSYLRRKGIASRNIHTDWFLGY